MYPARSLSVFGAQVRSMNGFCPTLLNTACKPLGTAGGNMSCTLRCTSPLSSPSTSTDGPSRYRQHGHGGDLVVVLLLPLKIAGREPRLVQAGKAARRSAQTLSLPCGFADRCADGRRRPGEGAVLVYAHSTPAAVLAHQVWRGSQSAAAAVGNTDETRTWFESPAEWPRSLTTSTA